MLWRIIDLSLDSELRSDTSEKLTEPVTWKFEKFSVKLTGGGMTESHYQHILSLKMGVVSSL